MEVPSIFLNRLLAEMAKRGASSLHLSVGAPPVARVADKLTPLENESILSADILTKIVESFIEEDEVKRLKEEKEIAIIKIFGGDFRFLVNIFYQKDLLSLSFNYIANNLRRLDDLSLPVQLKEKINLNSGLLIVAGPNDSGKTSTAAAIIEEINKNEKKYIITLENPIEYLFVNKKSIIEQRQIGRDVVSLATGLRHCLEEDVDLIYVGEVKREFEEAVPLILQLAAGNSLVILEINADNAVRVVEKILDAGKAKSSSEATRYILADVLIGVIAQKLIPRLGGGMALANEVLTVNSAVKSLIREGKIYQIESIIQTSRQDGMIGMEKSIEDLLKKGDIQATEVQKIN